MGTVSVHNGTCRSRSLRTACRRDQVVQGVWLLLAARESATTSTQSVTTVSVTYMHVRAERRRRPRAARAIRSSAERGPDAVVRRGAPGQTAPAHDGKLSGGPVASVTVMSAG